MNFELKSDSVRMSALTLIAEDTSTKLEFRRKLANLFKTKRQIGYALNELQKSGLIEYRWIITNEGQQVLHRLANQQ